jgi:hypothetical protein
VGFFSEYVSESLYEVFRSYPGYGRQRRYGMGKFMDSGNLLNRAVIESGFVTKAGINNDMKLKIIEFRIMRCDKHSADISRQAPFLNNNNASTHALDYPIPGIREIYYRKVRKSGCCLNLE